MKYPIVLLFLFSTQCIWAQKESNYWVFGCGKAITFNSGQAVSKNYPSPADSWRSSSATISTTDGKLLFYFAYGKLYDSSHAAMINGDMKCQTWTVQSAIIVPWPDSSHLFYVFTHQTGSTGFLTYSIVNMKLRAGLGDVESNKKNIALPTITSGKISAVRHANKRGYWVVTPQGNSDSINAYHITPNGIVNTPVKSKTGLYINGGQAYSTGDFNGFFKLSPDGRKLCNINNNRPSMIADFDPASGMVSNTWEFTSYSFGLEFSPKSRYLYLSGLGNILSQYDLESKTKTTFLASRKTIDSLGSSSDMYYNSAALQLASDGKIYIYNGFIKYLYVIHSPDSAGKKARVQRDFIQYTNATESGHYGLPNFVQSLFHIPSFQISQNCRRDTVYFKIPDSYVLDSARWDFGDPASGTLNTSNKTSNVFHTYKKSGRYKVKLLSYYPTYTDTIYESFFVNYPKPFLGNDTFVCKSDYIQLNPKGNFVSYKWGKGEKTKELFVKAGTFRLTATDYDGCVSSDTIVVKGVTIKPDFSISSAGECFRNNGFAFKETTKYTNDKQWKSTWYFSDSSFLIDTTAYKTFFYPGAHIVKLVSKSQLGCIDSINKTVYVYPQTKVDFTINDTEQCINENKFDLVNITKDTGTFSYTWMVDNEVVSSSTSLPDLVFVKTGKFNISLLSTSNKNCMDIVTKEIAILQSPKASFNWDLGCSRTPTNFTFTGSKPDLPITTSFEWRFNDEGISYLENPSYLFANAGNKTINLRLISSNGCIDVFKKAIEIKTQSKADFLAADVCENDSVVFINKSQDAESYLWKFGDGQVSKSKNPKHQYQTTSSTTFNVSLVAIVKDGCSDSIGKAVTVNENPESDFTYTLSPNGQIDFNANIKSATDYIWQLGNGDSARVKTPAFSYIYKKTSSYNVCLKVGNAAGCKTQTCKQISISLGISSLPSLSGFTIYPNPNTGNFTIELENPGKDISIEVFDLIGKLIIAVETNPAKTAYQIELNVVNGIYLVRVNNGGFVFHKKVIIRY